MLDSINSTVGNSNRYPPMNERVCLYLSLEGIQHFYDVGHRGGRQLVINRPEQFSHSCHSWSSSLSLFAFLSILNSLKKESRAAIVRHCFGVCGNYFAPDITLHGCRRWNRLPGPLRLGSIPCSAPSGSWLLAQLWVENLINLIYCWGSPVEPVICSNWYQLTDTDFSATATAEKGNNRMEMKKVQNWLLRWFGNF